MKKLVLVASIFIFATACSSKKKTDGLDDGSSIVQEGAIGSSGGGSDSGNIPGLTSVKFGYDEYTINDQAKEILAQNAQWLQTNPSASLQIEGHCDSRGSIEYNLTLGERRANAVKSYMVSIGAPDARLSVISYGEERPLDGSDTDSAHSANRRANFVPVQ